jgi:hypothetical protein
MSEARSNTLTSARAALWFASILALSAVVSARAEDKPPNECAAIGRVSLEATSGWAKVGAGLKRLNFTKGAAEHAGCPSGDRRCLDSAYVVGGDALLLGKASGAYVCARYLGLHESHFGWLQRAQLELPPAIFFPTWWDGFWSSRDNYPRRITIGYRDGVNFSISAELNGVIISGAFMPDGDHAEFAIGASGEPTSIATAGKGACILRLRVAGPYLLVENGDTCGYGEFGGVYGH